MSKQNWNNVLDYIKRNLGHPINMIEISDEEIVNYLKEHTLLEFSQYSPKKIYKIITEVNKTPITGSEYTYKIPLEEGEYIIDILDVYMDQDEMILDAIYTTQDAIDTVITNMALDAVRSLGVRNTWEFLPPDVLIFDKEVRNAIVVCNVPHTTLDTINPDMYNLYFKKLCLAEVKLLLASMRSKFEGLSTPFGQLNLNWQELKSEAQNDKTEVINALETLPPDHYVYIVV